MAEITGKVYDSVKWQEKFPEISVYISDSEGKILEPKVFTKTDDDGEYELSVSDNSFENDYIALKPQFGVVDSPIVKKINSSSTINFDVAQASGVAEQEEVEIIAVSDKSACLNAGGVWVDSEGNPTESNTQGRCLSKGKYDCDKSGGKWNSSKRECEKKYKTWELVTIIGGSVLAVFLVSAIVYDLTRKK